MNANNRLSLCASALLRLNRETAERLDDLEFFHAPSECASDLYVSVEREEAQILVEHGFTPDSYNEALVERTSERFAHFSGLYATAGEV